MKPEDRCTIMGDASWSGYRRAILFVGPAHVDPERIIWQWPLQRLGLVPRRAHPDIPFFIGGQDHWHRLRVDRLDDRVWRCREKTIDLMRPAVIRCCGTRHESKHSVVFMLLPSMIG
jgi:hypothetical protein